MRNSFELFFTDQTNAFFTCFTTAARDSLYAVISSTRPPNVLVLNVGYIISLSLQCKERFSVIYFQATGFSFKTAGNHTRMAAEKNIEFRLYNVIERVCWSHLQRPHPVSRFPLGLAGYPFVL